MRLASFISPIVFRQPHHLSNLTSWHPHMPFAFWCMDQLRPRTFVELGTHKGDSYCAFCQAVSELSQSTACYAVDTWVGDEHAGFYSDEVYETLKRYHDERYAAFSRLIRSTFDKAIAHFGDGTVDLLHIDGLHTYEAVKHDFMTWLPKLSDRGVVLMHDINVREHGFGVWKLWAELAARHPHFEFLHAHGLGVLAVGQSPPEAIQVLCALGANEQEQVREMFAHLGQHILIASERDALKREMASRDNRVEELQGEVARQNDQIATLKRNAAVRDDQLAGLRREVSNSKKKLANLQLKMESHKNAAEVARWLIRQRDRWAPQGTFRARLARLAIRSVRTLAREGLRAFVRKAARKVFSWRPRPARKPPAQPPKPDRTPDPGDARRPSLTWTCLPVLDWQEPVVPQARVGVVIPVYAGFEATRRCIESVLRAQNRTPTRVVAIDDCSPEPSISRFLDELAADGRIELLRNSSNLGFVQSVNRGMAELPDHDVILLNSDTEVAGDWIDRLVSHAHSDGNVGTVTPFSNNATICSYPTMEGQSTLPAGESTAHLDSVFRRANARRAVEIPTAVGFCMYIRRDCLSAVGPFDAETFGKGYGEENDFCMRASAKGWRHLLAGDVFVYHQGEVSFSHGGAKRKEEATRRLVALHPHYPALISRFVANDPVRPLRAAVSAFRYREAPRPLVLHVLHALLGGTEMHVRELAARLKGKANVLLLYPDGKSGAWLTDAHQADDLRLHVRLPADYELLVQMLRAVGLRRVHIHHWIGLNVPLRKLITDLEVPFDFTAHDYFSICPQIHLLDFLGRYCGEPGEAGCNRCILERPVPHASNIVWWRKENEWLLRDAERVICPSQDVARRLRRYVPSGKYVVVPHRDHPDRPVKEPNRVGPESALRIALLGHLVMHKGLASVVKVAELAHWVRAPLHFTVIGRISPVLGGFRTRLPNLRQTGLYRPGDLPDLLDEAQPDVIWLATPVPETFSFTLSEAMTAGLPIVASDLGAFSERLAGRPWTWLIDWNWSAEKLLEFFLTIRTRHFATGVPPQPPAQNGNLDGTVPSMAPSAFYGRNQYLGVGTSGASETQEKGA